MGEVQLLDCGHKPSPHAEFTTGYGVDSHGKKHCYDCCAARDRAEMIKTGRAVLYLTVENGRGTLTNWPGSFKLSGLYVRKGGHNIAGTRYDVWFSFEGAQWHGAQYGENTQLCHCRRLKGGAK